MLKKYTKISFMTAFLLSGAFAESFEPLPAPPIIVENDKTPNNGYGEIKPEEWLNPYGVNAFAISGTITSSDNREVEVAICNISGDEYQKVKTIDGKYKLYFPQIKSATREHIFKVITSEKIYFIDFGSDNYISSNDNFKVDKDIVWVYDDYGVKQPKDLKTLSLNTSSYDNFLNLNLSDVDKNKNIIDGSIKVADEFEGYVDIVAIAIDNGQEYPFNATKDSANSTLYNFKLKLLKEHSDYIFKIKINNIKTNSFKEMYYNFGNDHSESSEDLIVSNVNIDWIENSSNSGNKIPNTSKTSYLNVVTNLTLNTPIDTTTLGANDFKINGSITPMNDFFDYTSNSLKVILLNAKDGNYLTESFANCDKESKKCNYEVNLGSILNNIDGNNNGGYIIKISEVKKYREKFYYFDLGNDNSISGDENIKLSTDVGFNGNIPNINYFKIDKNSKENSVDIDMNNYTPPKEYKLSGSFTGIPESAKYLNVTIYNPKKNIWIFTNLTKESDGSYKFTKENIPSNSYIIRVDYTNNGKKYEYMLTDDDGDYSAGVNYKNSEDIVNGAFDNNENLLDTTKDNFDFNSVKFWGPSNIKMINLTSDVNMPIVDLKPLTYYDFNLTLNSLSTLKGKKASIELFADGSYVKKNQSIVIDEVTEKIDFSGLRSRNDYYLSIAIDGMERLYYDSSSDKLISNVYYVGYQDNQICEDYKNYIYNCDKNQKTNWKLNLQSGFSIGEGETSKSISFPTKNRINVNLALGSDYANKKVSLTLSQYRGNAYLWERVTANSNGDVNLSLPVNPEANYKVEFGIGLEWYAINSNSGNYELINSRNAYINSKPKDSILLDATNSNVEIGTLSLPSLYNITFNIENLAMNGNDIDENILVALSGTSWFGASNLNKSTNSYTNKVEFKAMAGDYKLNIYPSKNRNGLIDADGDSVDNDSDKITNSVDFTTNAKLTWSETKADTLTISGDTTINIKLKSLDSYKSILGSVNLGSGDIEAGWICATKESDGKCSEVSANGSFEIKSLTPSGDFKYLIEYWANSGEMIKEMVTMTNGENLSGVNIELKETEKISISGNVIDSSNEAKEVVLIEVANDNSWQIIDSIKIDTPINFNFTFKDLAPSLESYHYEVAIAKTIIDANSGIATYNMFDNKKSDNSLGVATNITDNNTITLTIN